MKRSISRTISAIIGEIPENYEQGPKLAGALVMIKADATYVPPEFSQEHWRKLTEVLKAYLPGTDTTWEIAIAGYVSGELPL